MPVDIVELISDHS